ncbi:hypothetical protein MUK42_34809 [Musa troglodytarum]|uniref:Uncharacterized protein n=1 Tax=Musa troglodytarum TaxID=320322 RepID=A0A9E7HHY4_9LILI|nr:hypothetical protein MUK42_34809 [Musa troglodytarum]
MAKSPFPFVLILLLLFLAVAVSAHGGSGGGDDDTDADAAGSNKPDLRSKSLILTKVWCLIVIFFATFLPGVSPYFLKWNEAFLALGTQFAGGVFLGTAMMHFLSDSDETFEDLTDKDYPFAFMLACAGFAITLLADCIISVVVARGRSVRDVESGQVLTGQFFESWQKVRIRVNRTRQAESPIPNKRPTTIFYVSEINNQQQYLKPKPPNIRNCFKLLELNLCTTHAKVGQGPGDHSVASLLRDAGSLGDSILLIFALCFHSVFEGIAIGVADTKADAWKALWTISLHKVFAAIAMGIALLRMMPNRPLLSCAAYSFAFAISSPIGVAIGIIIDATTQGRVADWIYAISMGLATGVFIYVSINHLLAKGFKPQKPVAADTPFIRWLAVVLGIGVIAVVMIWDT